MATRLLGTNNNNSIPFALAFSPVNLVADVATIQQHVLNDLDRLQVEPGGWTKDGWLYVPNRGFLRARPGDVVGVDNRGWPILLSGDTIANGLWTLT